MELSPHCPLCRSPVTPESLLVPPPMLQNSDVIIGTTKNIFHSHFISIYSDFELIY
jgi:hypothetical protein